MEDKTDTNEMADRKTSKIPKILNSRFHVVKRIGQGGFGRVYHAKDSTTNEDVAIKVFDEDCEDYARLELVTLQYLDMIDPDNRCFNVKVIHHFKEGRESSIVVPLLGPSIADFMINNSYIRYTFEELRHIAYQLCFQLNVLHKCKLLHGDIKAENVLLVSGLYRDAPYSSMVRRKKLINTQIKLIDFGYTTHINDYLKYSGTANYRSPEILLGLDWSFPSEVFAVGCTLFELYTGRILFNTTNNLLHLVAMMKVLGPIPKSMLKNSPQKNDVKQLKSGKKTWCTRRKMHFRQDKQHEPIKTYKMGKTVDDGQFFDLLKKMLRYKPNQRITLEQALSHPFFDRLPDHLKPIDDYDYDLDVD